MRRISEIAIGIAFGVLFGTCHIVSVTNHEIEKMEEEFEVQIASYEPRVPFAEQIKADEERIYQEYLASIEEKVIEPPFQDINLDDDYQFYLFERCKFYGIDFWLALALMESESTFNDKAVNGTSVGLMQINQCWWNHWEELDVNNPYDNIEMGLKILGDLLSKYDELTSIQCYKCGEYRGIELINEGIVIGQATYVINRAEEMRKSHTSEEVQP